MPFIQLCVTSPERLLFDDQVEQVDLPGADGDLGVLAGHAPVMVELRPGLVTAITGEARETFVVLGGIAEFRNETLTVLGEFAAHIEDFDIAEVEARIAETQEALADMPAGVELDRVVAMLDHYRSVEASLSVISAF